MDFQQTVSKAVYDEKTTIMVMTVIITVIIKSALFIGKLELFGKLLSAFLCHSAHSI